MSRERPNVQQVCWVSMASEAPKFCQKENCEAWYARGGECSIPAGVNSMAYNMFRMAQFKAHQINRNATVAMTSKRGRNKGKPMEAEEKEPL